MKTKKTRKRMNKVVALLSKIIHQLPGSNDGLGDVLDSAKAYVVRATKMLTSQASDRESKSKLRASAKKDEQGLAAKNRRAAAKRKGVNPVTGSRLSKAA
jgi:hypothetical protein